MSRADWSLPNYSTPTLHNKIRLKCQNDAFTEGIPMKRSAEHRQSMHDLLLAVKVLTQLPVFPCTVV